MRRISSLLISLFFVQLLAAQSDDEVIIQQVIEYILETSEEELDFTDLQQNLMGRLESPINLNEASFDDLKELGFLTEPEIIAILEHRNTHGMFLGTFELQAVDGLSPEKIRILSRFVTCTEYIDEGKETTADIAKGARGDVIIRYRNVLQKQRGYALNDSDETLGYQGSAHHIYARAGYRYKNKLSLGITAEKDAGEEFFKGSQSSGFDFYSGHVYISDIGLLKSLALGDFQAQFGQGLTLWSGLSFSKSADVMNVVRRPRKILPYRSVNENQFLRGAAATLGSDKISFTAFYSQKNVDANLINDTTDATESFFTALQVSGFHRTLSEIEDKNSITERIIGGNLETKLKGVTVGITTAGYQYNPGLIRERSPYQLHDFDGTALSNSGLYYNGLLGRVYVFGECSVNGLDFSTTSTVNGAIFSLSNSIDIAVLHRSYAVNYNGIYYGPFREQSVAQNEKALYLGLKVKLTEKMTLASYLDRFRFDWLRFRTDLPSNGYEYLVEWQYRPSKRFSMLARIKSQNKEQNLPDNETALDVLTMHLNTHYRVQFRYQINNHFSTTSRIEYATYKLADSNTSQGVLLFQDFAFKPLEKPYSFIMRYAMFNVEDFDSRIYTYEHDVLYAYSIPAYQNKGFRFYLLSRLKLNYRTDLWLRYAQTTYFNDNEVGSSNETIDGNTRSEVKLQLRVRF